MCCCGNCHMHGGGTTARITVGGGAGYWGGGSGYLPTDAYSSGDDAAERRHREVIKALAAIEQAIRDLPAANTKRARK